jgi:hypothetical protein
MRRSRTPIKPNLGGKHESQERHETEPDWFRV